MEEIAQGNPGGLLALSASDGVLHQNVAWLVEALEWVAAGIEIASIALLLIGAARFFLGWSRTEFLRSGAERLHATSAVRIELGRYILAALELFIVSDLIHVALSLRLADLLFLGLLVVIRSITSFFLDREMEQLERNMRA